MEGTSFRVLREFGPVALWHADTKQGGWCLGLRLSNGSWLGTPPEAGGSPLDGGGAVPGCFPTGVIDAQGKLTVKYKKGEKT